MCELLAKRTDFPKIATSGVGDTVRKTLHGGACGILPEAISSCNYVNQAAIAILMLQ